MISLLSHLSKVAGVRAQIAHGKRGPAIRLALPLGTSLDGGQLSELVTDVTAFVSRIDERAPLRTIDGQVDVAYFRKLMPKANDLPPVH